MKCEFAEWDPVAKCTHERAKNDMVPGREENLIQICLGMKEYCVFRRYGE